MIFLSLYVSLSLSLSFSVVVEESSCQAAESVNESVE